MGHERTQTGVCRGCGQVKGLRKDGTIAVHKVDKDGERFRCVGYARRPKGVA